MSPIVELKNELHKLAAVTTLRQLDPQRLYGDPRVQAQLDQQAIEHCLLLAGECRSKRRRR